VIDTESGYAIQTERVRYGQRVSVIAFPCDPIWRTPAGLERAELPGHLVELPRRLAVLLGHRGEHGPRRRFEALGQLRRHRGMESVQGGREGGLGLAAPMVPVARQPERGHRDDRHHGRRDLHL